MKRFLIPSLVAAGFVAQPSKAMLAFDGAHPPDNSNTRPLLQRFRLSHDFILAGHRSHSSHASHASHASHRSSTGGGYYTPAPTYRAPAPIYTPPASPSPKTLPGNSGKFTDIVKRVQVGLHAYGYYNGPIDGVIGPGSKNALREFQRQFGLKVTGTITPEVLDTLGIRAR